MKKITLLLFILLPLIGLSQVPNPTFDANVNGWSGFNGATVTHSLTEGSAAPGALQLDTDGATNNGRAQSDNFTIAVGETGFYRLNFMVKGDANNSVQGAFRQSGSSNGSGGNLTLTGGWDAYTAELNVLEEGNINLRLIGKELSSTYFFDDITFVKLTTQDTFAANPNFEATTDWTGSGGETTFSYITDTPQEGSQAGRLTFTADQTSNQFIDNTIFDFGETVSTEQVSSGFWVRASKAGVQVQVAYDIFDASGTQIGNTNNAASYTISAANTWEQVPVSNKTIDDNFNQIQYRLKVRNQTNALSGDTVDFDQVTASFNFAALSTDDFGSTSTEFTVFPNPAKDTVTIKGNSDISAISIYNVLGKKVLSNSKLINNTLNISSLNTGIYLLRLETIDGGITTKKIIKN